MFGILPDNKDELKIIYKGQHNTLYNNFNIEDGIPLFQKYVYFLIYLKIF